MKYLPQVRRQVVPAALSAEQAAVPGCAELLDVSAEQLD